jgi:hypothetical protein
LEGVFWENHPLLLSYTSVPFQSILKNCTFRPFLSACSTQLNQDNPVYFGSIFCIPPQGAKPGRFLAARMLFSRLRNTVLPPLKKTARSGILILPTDLMGAPVGEGEFPCRKTFYDLTMEET